MTAENKKLAMYGGGALVLGGVAFFVYSFFKKPVVLGKTTVTLGSDQANTEEPVTTTPATKNSANIFTDLLNQKIPTLDLPSISLGLK